MGKTEIVLCLYLSCLMSLYLHIKYQMLLSIGYSKTFTFILVLTHAQCMKRWCNILEKNWNRYGRGHISWKWWMVSGKRRCQLYKYKPFSHWGLSQDMSRDISQAWKIPAIIIYNISVQVILKSQKSIPRCCCLS